MNLLWFIRILRTPRCFTDYLLNLLSFCRSLVLHHSVVFPHLTSCCEVKLHTNTTRKSHNHKILLQNQKSLLYFTDMVSIVKLLRNTTFDCLFSNQYGNWRKLGLLYFVLSLNTWYTWFLFSALIDENFGYFNF